MAAITINDLLEAGVHFGHQTKRWNPKMKPYIYGARNGISIFDLTITIRHLAAACEFLRDLAADGRTILFVGSKRQSQEVLRDAAQRCGMPYMVDRWLGGAMTNFSVIHRRILHLRELQQQLGDGSLDKRPKKELARIRREYEKLVTTLGGVITLDRLPDALVVVDVCHEDIAVREANRLGVPVVAIVDSNGNPDNIERVIPGNDDALRSIKILVDALAAAVEEGRQQCVKQVEAEDEQDAAADKVAADEAEAAGDAEAETAEAAAKE